jgi:2-keto-4-pentenoate hydratase/2-oxohepta-3-ene-1,7-dioic acid hydratase in catechol pathway
MRLAGLRRPEGPRLAAVIGDDTVALLPEHLGSLDDVVRGGPAALEAARRAAESAEQVPLDRTQLDAPLRRFNRDLLCSGWNYWDHYEESHGKREGQDPAQRPEHPTFFTKGPDTVIGPDDDIAFDAALSQKWDYEAEVALVIGRDGRSIPAERAWEHVFGLFVANDVSQRDLQRAHGGQWLKGKSIDQTMPIGPWVTTPDELDDPSALQIELVRNGELLQSASTRQMAFGIEQLIAELSWGMTLRAGDVLLTGTPSGIGNAREPQIFLVDGDVLETRVSQLGALHNRVRAFDLTTPGVREPAQATVT